MKFFLILLLSFGTFSAFATTNLNCQSANYEIIVTDIEGQAMANYGINGEMNDGADVEIEKLYLSERIIALSLKVDGQPGKFEAAVSKISDGKYAGQIFCGKDIQKLSCIRQ